MSHVHLQDFTAGSHSLRRHADVLSVQLEQRHRSHIFCGCYAGRSCWRRGNHLNIHPCVHLSALQVLEIIFVLTLIPVPTSCANVCYLHKYPSRHMDVWVFLREEYMQKGLPLLCRSLTKASASSTWLESASVHLTLRQEQQSWSYCNNTTHLQAPCRPG